MVRAGDLQSHPSSWSHPWGTGDGKGPRGLGVSQGEGYIPCNSDVEGLPRSRKEKKQVGEPLLGTR